MSEVFSAADPRFVTRDRQPGLDLLRALAIVVVAFYHAGIFGFTLPYRAERFGWVGVDLFFVLSGYLIAGQLFASMTRGRELNLRRFFSRRGLRILPAYLVVVGVYLLLPALREYPEMPPAWKFFAFVQNLGLHGGTAFSHAWSLSVEAQFYLVLPFLLRFFAPSSRGWIAVAAGVIIGGMLLRFAIASVTAVEGVVPFRAFQSLIYYPTWTRLDPLTLGVSLAAIQRFRSSWWTRLAKAAPWLAPAGLFAIALGLYIGESELRVAVCVWQFPLIAFGMATLLVCAVSPRLPFIRVEVPGAAFVASIAYSVYLSHKLVIHFAGNVCRANGIAQTSPAAIGLWVVAVAVLGVILFFAVERPFLQIRQRRSDKVLRLNSPSRNDRFRDTMRDG